VSRAEREGKRAQRGGGEAAMGEVWSLFPFLVMCGGACARLPVVEEGGATPTFDALSVSCVQEEKVKEEAAAEKGKEAAVAEEEEAAAAGEEKKEDAPPPPPPPEEVVMRVFMHCEGCARKVKKILRGFDGNGESLFSSSFSVYL
jgi:Heavy-metal-associated domain.